MNALPATSGRNAFPYRRHAGLLVLGLLVGFAGQKASFALWFPPTHFASLWVPGGIALALFLLRPRRDWWSFALGLAVGGTVALMTRRGPLPHSFALYTILVLAMMGTARILGPARQPLLGDLAAVTRYFLLALVALPLFTGGISAAAAVSTSLRSGLVEMWLVLTPAQSMGFLLLTPPIVAVANYRRRAIRQPARIVEALLLGMGLMLLSLGLWMVAPARPGLLPLLLFAPIPVLLLMALRFGELGASFGLLAVAVPAAWLGIYRNGPFSISDGQFNVHTLQLWLLVVGFLVYALSALSRQQRATQRKLDASHERIRDLATRLLQGQEEERARIARELHDGVNQQVASLAIMLSMLKREDPARLSDRLDELHASMVALSDDVRRISHNLHPALLQQIGLVGALKALVHEESQRWTGELWLNCGPDGGRRDYPAGLCLYRIAQEALHNATRHANAKNVWLILRQDQDECFLEVMDDGDGFDIAAARRAGGLGLLSMEERARLAHGRLYLRSEAGVGTSVSVRVPRQPTAPLVGAT